MFFSFVEEKEQKKKISCPLALVPALEIRVCIAKVSGTRGENLPGHHPGVSTRFGYLPDGNSAFCLPNDLREASINHLGSVRPVIDFVLSFAIRDLRLLSSYGQAKQDYKNLSIYVLFFYSHIERVREREKELVTR